MEGKSIAIIEISLSSKMEHISNTRIGEGLLKALFPSIIFAPVKAMTLVESMASKMLTIPSSFHHPRHIDYKPPNEQRRISSNSVWCESRSRVAPRVQVSVIFTTSTQRRRYWIILVLKITFSPRTWKGGPSQLILPTYNLSTLGIWIKLIF